jgi:hypothetical protein
MVEEITVIPRRFSCSRRAQLTWDVRGVLGAGVWTRSFVKAWGVMFVVFAAFGTGWGWLMASRGDVALGVFGACFSVLLWLVLLGMSLRGAAAGARSGPVCEVDRAHGVVRALREGVDVPLRDVLAVRVVAFSLESSPGPRGVVMSNQLQLVTNRGTIPLATNVSGVNSARAMARDLSVEFSECGAPRQVLAEWERALGGGAAGQSVHPAR